MYLSFNLENIITVGVMVMLWTVILHTLGQVFQNLTGGAT